MQKKKTILGAFPKLRKAGCRSHVHEICHPLGYYAVYSGNSLPTFRDKLTPIFIGQEIQEEK